MTILLPSMSPQGTTGAVADAVEAPHGGPGTGIAPSFVIDSTWPSDQWTAKRRDLTLQVPNGPTY
jgi:hypothetical protein